MWTESSPEYVESQISHVGWAHSWCRQPSSPSPKADHAGLFATRCMDNSTSNRLTTATAKRVATFCRLINIMKDEVVLGKIHIASNDCSYEFFSRATTVIKIHNLYEHKKADVEEVLALTNVVLLTSDYSTSLSIVISGHSTLHYAKSKHSTVDKSIKIAKHMPLIYI